MAERAASEETGDLGSDGSGTWTAVSDRERRMMRRALPPAEGANAPVDAIVHVKPSPHAGLVVPSVERHRRHRVWIPGWLDPRLVLLTEPESARAAGFRLLCDNLLARGLPPVLAVSSATAQDGKTTCAVNLALALAERSSASTLLVDGNFLEPSLAAMFSIDENTPPAPSLEMPWLGPFRLVELTPRLHVAAVVRPRGEPLAHFEKHSFDILVDRLSELGYDRMIIDAPALDGAPAVGRLVSLADGVLLVVRTGRTTTRALRGAIEQVGPDKAFGTVLIE